MRIWYKRKYYDLDTARFICKDADKILYCKKTGEYFLHYKKASNNGMVDAVEPMSMREASDFASTRMVAAEFIKEFNVFFSEEKKSDLRTKLSNASAIKLRCLAINKKQSNAIEAVIDKAIDTEFKAQLNNAKYCVSLIKEIFIEEENYRYKDSQGTITRIAEAYNFEKYYELGITKNMLQDYTLGLLSKIMQKLEKTSAFEARTHVTDQGELICGINKCFYNISLLIKELYGIKILTTWNDGIVDTTPFRKFYAEARANLPEMRKERLEQAEKTNDF